MSLPKGTSSKAIVDPAPVILAGFWRRVASGLLDALILSPMVLSFLYLWIKILWVEIPDGRLDLLDWLVTAPFVPDPMLLIGFLFAGLSASAYFFFFTGIWSATPGQRLVNITIIGPAGGPAGWLRAALRTLLLILSVGYLLLGVLWIAFDRLHQGWHDKLSGTFVITTDGP